MNLLVYLITGVHFSVISYLNVMSVIADGATRYAVTQAG